MARTSASTATSQRTKSASAPAAFNSRSRGSPFPTSRLVRMSRAPVWANRRAEASPMPWLAPVTMIDFQVSVPVMVVCPLVGRDVLFAFQPPSVNAWWGQVRLPRSPDAGLAVQRDPMSVTSFVVLRHPKPPAARPAHAADGGIRLRVAGQAQAGVIPFDRDPR